MGICKTPDTPSTMWLIVWLRRNGEGYLAPYFLKGQKEKEEEEERPTLTLGKIS